MEIGWRRRRSKILVPHLKGLVKPVTPCVYTQNAQFCFGGAFSLGPQEGKICVATSDSVPLLPPPPPREGRGYVATSDLQHTGTLLSFTLIVPQLPQDTAFGEPLLSSDVLAFHAHAELAN